MRAEATARFESTALAELVRCEDYQRICCEPLSALTSATATARASGKAIPLKP